MRGSDPASSLSPDSVLQALEQGEIDEEFGLLRWSSNYAFLVGIQHKTVKLTAVYKPQRGERPLWDFPDGTLCYREMASFLTSEQLGWQIVPPTALRDGPHGKGSFQLFIEHNPDQNYFSFDETLKPQLMRIAAFDVLVNNADRKGGHCLLDCDGHIWGIDHGITFHSAHKLRTVIWDFAGQPVPDVLLEDIERLCSESENESSLYRQRMLNLISATEFNAFQNRIRRILRTRRYPTPGPGPNYPWPPV